MTPALGRRRAKWSGRLGWLLALALLVPNCKPADPYANEDHEQRCLNGDHVACARACKLGVHGKGGCMGATTDANPMRRTQMLTQACDAREAGACALAAEASIASGISNPSLYQTLLTRACDQKDERGCTKLGDFQLFDSLESAQAAYDKGCRLESSHSSACSNEARKRVAAIGSDRTACQQNDLAACERLLRGAASRNHDLGYLGSEAVCRLRGLTQFYARTELRHAYKLRKRRASYDSCGLFLLARADADPAQFPEFRRIPLPEPSVAAGRGHVALASLAFQFRDAPSAQPEAIAAFKAGVEARIRERLALATRCYDEHLVTHPGTHGEFEASFIVDKLGEPGEVRASSELTHPELSACLLSAAIPERFSGLSADLGSIVRAEAKLVLSTSGPRAR